MKKTSSISSQCKHLVSLSALFYGSCQLPASICNICEAAAHTKGTNLGVLVHNIMPEFLLYDKVSVMLTSSRSFFQYFASLINFLSFAA